MRLSADLQGIRGILSNNGHVPVRFRGTAGNINRRIDDGSIHPDPKVHRELFLHLQTATAHGKQLGDTHFGHITKKLGIK